jgi:hypothetical protein
VGQKEAEKSASYLTPDHCAVLDVAKLAAGDVAFGSNSWRGDEYESALRNAIRAREQAAMKEVSHDE